MFVYVARFENYPDLIKIGVSVSPASRTGGLSRIHGKVVSSEVFLIGDDVYKVEKGLHRKHKRVCAKDTVGFSDGYTEFFQDSIYDDVCKELNGYTDGTRFRKSQLEKMVLTEDIRCAKLVSRLLGCGHNHMYDGSRTQLFSGFWELTSINSCIDMGFDKEEVFAKYVSSGKPRLRTTAGRVAIAHSLFTGLVFTSSKMKYLRKLLDNQ